MTLYDAVRIELTRMLARQLDYAPGADELPFTIQVMTDDLTRRGLMDSDFDRVAEAFRVLGPQTQRWPTSRMVIECLPARQEAKQLSAPRTKPEVVAVELGKITRHKILRSVFRPGESFKDYRDALHKSGLPQKDFEAKRLVEKGWTAEMERIFREHAHVCLLGVLPGAMPEDIERASRQSDPEAAAERAAIQAE